MRKKGLFVSMKNKLLKVFVIILILAFLIVGFVPDVNNFLKNHITYEEYTLLIMGLVFITFEIILYLKLNDKMKPAFNLMEADIDFKKYKKEKKYKEDKSFYYRDIPFNKNMFKTFWIAFQYGIIKNRANVLNALLLKWCKENRIRFISKGKYEIIESEMDFDDGNEASLFYMLRNTSKNKFIKLTMFNSKFIFQKINDILLTETSILKSENKILKRNGKDIITNNIKPDVDIVFGFKNFLLNFSRIEGRKPEEVKLWGEYLIYAELLGISDRVKKEFKKANIDYISREIKFKSINRKMVNFIKILLCISYLFYGLLFIVFTSFIWLTYIKLTWGV